MLRSLNKKIGKHVVHQAIRAYSNSKSTLDLGCGNSPFRADFPSRIGTDIVSGKGVQVISDAHWLPFRDGQFEQVVCSEVLEHLVNPHQAVAEMSRVLQPGGQLILSIPFVYPLHEGPYDYQRFTYYGLQQLLTPLFDIQEISSLFTEEQTIAILLQRIVFQRQNARWRRWLYLLLAQLLFRLSPRKTPIRYQNIANSVRGYFMTANYLVIAHKSK